MVAEVTFFRLFRSRCNNLWNFAEFPATPHIENLF